MSEFLAEAAVLIQANTVAFRNELAAALATVPKGIEIPIIAVARTGTVASAIATMEREATAASAAASAASAQTAASAATATKALDAEAAAATRAAVALQKTGASSAAIAAFNKRLADTSALLARAQQTVSAVTGASISPTVRAQRAALALAEAEKLLEVSGFGAVRSQQALAVSVVDQARTLNASAVAALRAAEAQELAATAASHNAVAVRNAARGSATAGLAAAGLRGATLTANAGFIAGAAAAITFGKAIQQATRFETSLNVFAATAGATGAQMAEVSKAARQLGADITLPSVNAQDAADAMAELAKAGLSVEDSMDGARGVLQLATAAAIDNAQATELAASALNAFGLSGDQAVHVADVLTNAANQSQGSIVDMGTALSQAAAVARQAGLSLETTSAILTLFARNGLRGSDAGTSLRTALIRLINPTDKAAKIIHDLGLNIRTASGAVDVTVFDQFAQATRNMTAAQRDQALAVIFGQDAIRGATILAREGTSGLNTQTAAMNKAGSAAELAAARTKGLAGAFENAKNQAAQFGLTLGELASGPVQALLIGTGNLFESINKISEKIGNAFNPPRQDLGNTIASAAAQLGELQRALATDPFGPFAAQMKASLKDVETQLTQLGQEAVRKGFLTRFVEDFSRISPAVKQAMQDNVITPSEQAQLSADGIGRAFLAALPHTAEFFQSFGAGAKSGIEDASAQVRAGTPQLASAMRSTIEDASAQAKATAAEQGRDAGATFSNALAAGISAGRAAINKAFANTAASARLSIASASSEITDLEFGGASDQQILAALKRKKARQDRLVATLEARPKAKRANIDRAKQDAIATQNEIESVQARIDAAAQATVQAAKQAAAERTRRAKEIQDANNAADQAVLDSFAGGQNRINLAQIDANASERLSDDIAVQKLIANTASREIAIIEKTVKDVKARNAAIAARVQVLKAAGAELDRLRKEQADAQATKAQAARDAVTATLEKKLQLAQIIGKKDPILDAFDALIANERKSLAAAKKADKLDALIKLQQTIKDRADFVESLKKDAADGVKQATTAFDLLTQFAEVFNQNAGNLIDANQPFAGPTGFTADIAQFLIRRQRPAQPQFPGKAADNTLVQANTRLTDAIIDLTDTIRTTGSGNATTQPRVSSQRASRVWHSENMMARQFQEG
jgi:TP901 family phage tail tape measure protein